MFKTDFKYEKYLDVIASAKLRKQLSRFVVCSHSLEIETGRYYSTKRNDRESWIDRTKRFHDDVADF